MGTQTGYINNTSSTAVRTSLIKKCPFPNERASEDFHTWMRLSARGAEYRFIPEIPTLYRVPSYMEYQSSRMRIGPSAFNSIKARVDSQGFSLACELALARGVLSMERIPSLKAKFYRRLAQTMTRENEEELSNMLMYLAHQHECEYRLYNNN